MKNSSKLSFVICAYKKSPYLEECIKSLLNQEEKCKISIATSTPNELIKKMAKKYKLELYINENSNGYYDDFLFAYNKCNTKYVTLCHQDDIYMPNFSKEIIKKIERNTDDILLLFSNYYDYKLEKIIKHSKLLLVKRILCYPLKFKLFQKSNRIRRRILSFGNPICSPTVTFNRNKIEEPVVKCPFRTSHDWYTWIKIAKEKGRFVYISKPLLLRRINELSETSTVIADNSKKQSDLEIFKMFWPDKIAKIIAKIYGISENNNTIESNTDLLIIDDNFPVKESEFRYIEFNKLLKKIDNSKVLSTFESIRYSNKKSKKSILNNESKEINNLVLTKIPNNINKCKMLYGLFLYNTYNYILPIAEKYHIPFVFTLYPGGRFSINSNKSDMQLKKIFKSNYFKKVIVTQKITYDYLINKKLCSKEKIEYIYGGIINEENFNKNINHNRNNNELNICFVAFKYTKLGEDKGYDIFIKIVNKYKNNPNIHFHVVGNFDENILPIENTKNIKFYGIRDPKWLDNFYKNMDMIISPNIPGKINKGSFDGFPTTCVLDAGLNEVAMFCTDDLKSNDNYFKDGKDIVIIKHDINDISKKIDYYYKNKEELINIGINGRKKIQELYNYNSQIEPRVKLIKSIINTNKNNYINAKKIFNFKINIKIKIKYIINNLYGKIKRK